MTEAPPAPQPQTGLRCRVKSKADTEASGSSSKKKQRTSGAVSPTPSDSVEDSHLISMTDLKLERRVGSGGSGSTYLAAWRGAKVAVKVVGTGTSNLSEWRAEVVTLTRLRHPHIVQYLGAVVEPPTHCLVLEYCAGGDLRTALRLPTPPGLALKAYDGIASGMAYLHRRRIMHRDLKSANVLIDGGGVIKLTDFGVAIEMSERDLSEMNDAAVLGGATPRNDTGGGGSSGGGGGGGGDPFGSTNPF